MIKKILIANRGEIALRVIRTCREMGIQTVAVYSEIDRTALHVRFADEAYLLGPAPASESYLNIDKMIEVAKKAKADAIHPGYGFLSENGDFAERCAKEKIKFIGPSAKTIRQVGDKISARKLADKAGVPPVPGCPDILKNIDDAKKIASTIGYPVMLKAKAGGGGKGMRRVDSEKEIESAFRLASSEAKQSFKDDSLYLEKYIEGPHHVELQILGDEQGNVVCLGERECSVQRRHQKIVEESPSPFISGKTRKTMMEAAIKLAKASNYYSAGTVECLVDAKQNFYFLEINARLQVEHPVTEMVTGLDLVKAQIEIADGKINGEWASSDNPRWTSPVSGLPSTPTRHLSYGHSIECRIYAEDPDDGFMPSPGTITELRAPSGPNVRVDSAVYSGSEISVHYDPMISKLVTWGKDRIEAIARMKRALEEYEIVGIKSNIAFHEKIMTNKDFVAGKYDTGFVSKLSKNVGAAPCGRPNSAGRDGDLPLQEIAKIGAAAAFLKNRKTKNSAQVTSRSPWKFTARREGME